MQTLVVCSLLFLLGSTSRAGTIEFSEFGVDSLIDVNGVHFQGVLFGFSPGTAYFNQTVGTPGTAIYSTDPILSGPTSGVLALAFDAPSAWIHFDVLLQSIFPLDESSMGSNGGPAFTVQLSSGEVITGSAAPDPSGLYSEGQFAYSGIPVSAAVLTFYNGVDAGGMQVAAFGLDNLSVNSPEPATFWLLGTGLLMAGSIGGRRKRRP
jgi:hypothetical protein